MAEHADSSYAELERSEAGGLHCTGCSTWRAEGWRALHEKGASRRAGRMAWLAIVLLSLLPVR